VGHQQDVDTVVTAATVDHRDGACVFESAPDEGFDGPIALPMNRFPAGRKPSPTRACALMVGFATFGVLSFHMVTRGVLPAAAVPLIYAAAMAADAAVALISGWAYDRIGAKTLPHCRSYPH